MRDAVQAFEARAYTPPVWARNAHLHTIVASGDMELKLLGDRTVCRIVFVSSQGVLKPTKSVRIPGRFTVVESFGGSMWSACAQHFRVQPYFASIERKWFGYRL